MKCAGTAGGYRKCDTPAGDRWWKYDRPKRPDPMEVSGWSAYYAEKCEQAKDSGDDSLFPLERETSPEDLERSRKLTLDLHAIEEEQKNEDTQMLIRLVNKIAVHYGPE